ncbi:hypothetical protein Aglo03_27960 [Actinokineospora globicatena]|uniref:Uncharacterized protein n=1 Tax=Actinokineospora globicatena TaxID=103729 RepID=A0A9W6QLR9_9PSEU|nr:hypothetical protein Aglo03_27960 [Actinokineospora globicatena]
MDRRDLGNVGSARSDSLDRERGRRWTASPGDVESRSVEAITAAITKLEPERPGGAAELGYIEHGDAADLDPGELGVDERGDAAELSLAEQGVAAELDPVNQVVPRDNVVLLRPASEP